MDYLLRCGAERLHFGCYYAIILSMSKVTEDMRALGVRVPKRLIKQLKQIALDRDCSLGDLIVPVLEAVAKNQAKK